MAAYDAIGRDVLVIKQDFMIESERIPRNIYRIDLRYSRIYVDYEDTLVVRERVSEELMNFLYQSLNNGNAISLHARHKDDMGAELTARCVCKDLFSEIIHLPPDSDKIAFLQPDSIYLDNMFHDREKAASLGIPVFDVDAVPWLSCACQNVENTRSGKRYIRCDFLAPR